MKKFTLILALSACLTGLMAQPVLTYQNHALKPGQDNPMTYCSYSEPGISGANIVWDFSSLVAEKQFIGEIKENYKSAYSQANTELVEFGVCFYFDINEKNIQHVGYASADGKTKVIYSDPFEKLRYPFEMNDSYSSGFSGDYTYNDKVIGTIDGEGEVFADAWGTIKLPNNTVYDNTLRVKSTKTYSLKFGNTSQDVEITTYRWYNKVHRYPLLTLSESKTTVNSNTSTSYQSAYNSDAISEISSVPIAENINLSIFPNPASDENVFLKFNSLYSGEVSVSVFDITGKVVVASVSKSVLTGANTLDLSSELSGVKQGSYLLQLTIQDMVITEEMTIIK